MRRKTANQRLMNRHVVLQFIGKVEAIVQAISRKLYRGCGGIRFDLMHVLTAGKTLSDGYK